MKLLISACRRAAGVGRGPERIFQPRTALGTLQLRDLYVVNDKKRPDLSKGGKSRMATSSSRTTGRPIV